MIQRRADNETLPVEAASAAPAVAPAPAPPDLPLKAAPKMPSPAFQVRKPLSRRAGMWLTQGAFIIPLLLWCAVSYVPFIWHPKVTISNPGSVDYFQTGMQVDRSEFRDENKKAATEGRALATGTRENPVYLPAPHLVAKALVTAFRTPPGMSSHSTACSRQATWLRDRARSRCRLDHTCSTAV